jgi:hypothetical protein
MLCPTDLASLQTGARLWRKGGFSARLFNGNLIAS